ncbi:MAG: LysM peptidoglycan-binding domain-containing protein [Alphaproteobacteria bacterium]|nr:LysM peptidoglycan-binding domain-containing protein [Alphaproteobacteria bacterium]
MAVIGGLAVAAAIAVNFVLWREEPARKPASTPAGAEAPALPGASAPAKLPAFDVVRINPKGDAVIAGRAVPDSIVVILDGGKSIGEARADQRGEWVFVPAKPLEPGNRELSLEMRVPGQPPAPSETVVALAVPERDKDLAGNPAAGQALALRQSRDGSGPSAVLQKPAFEGNVGFAIDAVDYDDKGGVAISGRGAPKTTVRVYLDDRFLDSAEVGADNRWTFVPRTPIAKGDYKLRADQIGADNKVTARAETPFSRAEIAADLKPGSFAVVQPGNSLWRLARRTYGLGMRYTLIFEANKDQIRDPNLIYPGQIIQLPK